MTTNEYQVSFLGGENVLILIVAMMVAKHCEYTKKLTCPS